MNMLSSLDIDQYVERVVNECTKEILLFIISHINMCVLCMRRSFCHMFVQLGTIRGRQRPWFYFKLENLQGSLQKTWD